MISSRKISDSKFISGILKKAIFLSTNFSTIDGKHSFRIKQIEEESSRSENTLRTVKIALSDSDLIGGESKWHGYCGDLKIEFIATIDEKQGFNTRTMSFPVEVLLTKAREGLRFQSSDLSGFTSNCVIKLNDGRNILVVMEIRDHSPDGFGGILEMQGNEKISNEDLKGSSISGKIRSKNGDIPLNGTLQWLKEFSDGRFSFGVLREKIKSEKSEARAERVSSKINITCITPLNPNQTHNFSIENISHSGALLKPDHPSASRWFIPELTFYLDEPKIYARVVGNNNNCVRVKFISAESRELIKLSKIVARLRFPEFQHYSPDGSDLVDLMTASGAMSSSAASISAPLLNRFIHNHRSIDQETSWLFKWYDTDNQGNLRGTELICYYGPKIWYIGGLAGHVDSQLRIEKHFVPAQMKHFREFLKECLPDHDVIFNWTNGHKFWKDWNAELDNLASSGLVNRFLGWKTFFKPNYNFEYSGECADATLTNIENFRNQPYWDVGIKKVFEKAISFQAGSSVDPIWNDEKKRTPIRHILKHINIDGNEYIISSIVYPDSVHGSGITNFPLVFAIGIQPDPTSKKLNEFISSFMNSESIQATGFYLFWYRGGYVEESVKVEGPVCNSEKVIWTIGKYSSLNFWEAK